MNETTTTTTDTEFGTAAWSDEKLAVNLRLLSGRKGMGARQRRMLEAIEAETARRAEEG